MADRQRQDASSRPSTHLRRWGLLFVALYPLMAVWSLTNPMFASPDETVHIVRAQSFARADFSAPFTTDGVPVESVECFRFRPDTPAACQDLTWGPDGTQRDATTEGYPPLFHAIAAVPALAFTGLTGTYLMRLWLAAVVVAVLAWAGTLILRLGRGPLPLAGFVLAITPTATFVSSTVNPSGLAMATALLFVAGGLTWYCDRTLGRVGALAIGVGAAGLALGRRDGVLWLALVCLVLAPLWWAPLTRILRRRVWLSISIVAAVLAAAALAASILARTTISKLSSDWSEGRGTNAWEALARVRIYFYEMFGVFGWLDTRIGEEAFSVAAVTYGFFVMLALISTSRALIASTATSLLVLVASPVAIGLITFPYLQGRYLFPVFAALMLVGGVSASVGDTSLTFKSRASYVLLGSWVIVQLVAGLQNMRRYAVGWGGLWDFVADAEWHPDTMSNAAAACSLVAALLVAAIALGRLMRDLSLESGHGEPVAHEGCLNAHEVMCACRTTSWKGEGSTDGSSENGLSSFGQRARSSRDSRG